MYSTKFHTKDISQLSFLVTGGAGFIGSNIVEYLLKYNAKKVRVFDDLSNGYLSNLEAFKDNAAFEFVEGDICDFDACTNVCKGMDYVCHQAAMGSVPRSINNPMATNQNNVSGFVNILFAAKEAGIKRFVYASSSSVYGDSIKSPKVEEEIGKPLSPYAVSKYTNELYAGVFQGLYGIETIGLRYFNIYGPRQNPKGPYAAVIPLFIEALMKNEQPKIFGDGVQTRDFTFVENAVQANIKAMLVDENFEKSQVFNVAVGETIALNNLYQLLATIANSQLKPVYVAERRGDIKNSLANISKIKQQIGYDPQVKVEEGLGITYKWFVENFKF